jgi:hypothetical protein
VRLLALTCEGKRSGGVREFSRRPASGDGQSHAGIAIDRPDGLDLEDPENAFGWNEELAVLLEQERTSLRESAIPFEPSQARRPIRRLMQS